MYLTQLFLETEAISNEAIRISFQCTGVLRFSLLIQDHLLFTAPWVLVIWRGGGKGVGVEILVRQRKNVKLNWIYQVSCRFNKKLWSVSSSLKLAPRIELKVCDLWAKLLTKTSLCLHSVCYLPVPFSPRPLQNSDLATFFKHEDCITSSFFFLLVSLKNLFFCINL